MSRLSFLDQLGCARCQACGQLWPGDFQTPLCDDCYVRACEDVQDDPRAQLEALLASCVDPAEPELECGPGCIEAALCYACDEARGDMI